MSHHCLSYAQEQMDLMPPAITDWVAEGSLTRFMSEILKEMDRDGNSARRFETRDVPGDASPNTPRPETGWSGSR